MPNLNTLEQWRPNPFVYFYCSLAVVSMAIVCSWGVALLLGAVLAPEKTIDFAILGLGLFILLLWLALRRCSAPQLPGFRGLLLVTAYMSIGVGSFSLLFVIPAVAFAIIAILGIAFLSLFKDNDYARRQFWKLVEFYRRHRMYQ